MPYSKTLDRIARTDDRVDSYEYDPSNDMGAHWLHLAWPWVDQDGTGSIHEQTVKNALSEYAAIKEGATNERW